MNILIISRGYPTKKYKMNGIFEFDQAKALVEAGIEVVYAAIDVRSIRRWRKWGYESFVKEGVHIESINIPCGRIPNNVLDKIKEFSFSKLYKKTVKKYGKPDIVHSHFIGMGYITAKVLKNSDIPLVHTEHLSGMNQEVLSDYNKHLGNNTYRFMDKVLAVSKSLADNLKNKFSIEPIVIHNIVDTSSFQYRPLIEYNDSFNFISVGGLIIRKRMDLLIKSFHDAFNNNNIRLYIYGEGPERKNLETLISNLNLTEQVFLMGSADRKVIARKMQESHCFVLVSRLETFGVACIEAMATWLPVIATKCGGPENYVNASNGLIIPIDDQEKLTKALVIMYNDVKRYNREKISKEAIEKFGSHNIAKLLTDEYYKILKEEMLDY